jgi:hypothetical protein
MTESPTAVTGPAAWTVTETGGGEDVVGGDFCGATAMTDGGGVGDGEGGIVAVVGGTIEVEEVVDGVVVVGGDAWSA